MSEQNFFSYGDAESVLANYATAIKNIVVQVSTMPTASASLLGKIYQFVGTTTSSYTNGYFYKCVEGSTSGTYEWSAVDVQASGNTVDSALSTTSENPVQNKVVTTEINKKQNKDLFIEITLPVSDWSDDSVDITQTITLYPTYEIDYNNSAIVMNIGYDDVKTWDEYNIEVVYDTQFVNNTHYLKSITFFTNEVPDGNLWCVLAITDDIVITEVT